MGGEGGNCLSAARTPEGFGLPRDSLGGFFGGLAMSVGHVRGRRDGARKAGCADGARGFARGDA